MSTWKYGAVLVVLRVAVVPGVPAIDPRPVVVVKLFW
jgi:hypothetical protein